MSHWADCSPWVFACALIAGCAQAGFEAPVDPVDDVDAAPLVFIDARAPDVPDAAVASGADAGLWIAFCGDAEPPQAYTFVAPDVVPAQTYTVPAGVTSILVKAWGAGGGAGTSSAGTPGAGGGGAFVVMTAAVTPGEVLTVRPGQGGHMPGGGGGASYLMRSDSTAVLIAAGGGGGGTDGGGTMTVNSHGGAGGEEVGEDGIGEGYSPYGDATAGLGGSAIAGGAAGVGTVLAGSGTACAGGAGGGNRGGFAGAGYGACNAPDGASFEQAGSGGSNGGAGSGGGGYYGGGGGGSVSTYFGGGGGGGSSYYAGGAAIGGSGQIPGNPTDPDYQDDAGRGGDYGDWPTTDSHPGNHGLIILCQPLVVP